MPFTLFLHRQTLTPLASAAVGPDQLVVNEAVLRRAWESSQRSTPEDWAEWARHFAVELLRNSPSPALRANYRLAEVRPVFWMPQPYMGVSWWSILTV